MSARIWAWIAGGVLVFGVLASLMDKGEYLFLCGGLAGFGLGWWAGRDALWAKLDHLERTVGEGRSLFERVARLERRVKRGDPKESAPE